MKLQFSKEDLLEGLQTVQGVTAGRNSLPILSNVLITAAADTIQIAATDLEVSIQVNVSGVIIDEGGITADSRKLSEIVRALPDNEVTLTTTANDRIQIACGDGVYTIIGLPFEDFPELPLANDKYFVMDGDFVGEMIDKTVFSASGDESRYFLNGLYFHLTNEITEIVATDGRRLALASSKDMTLETEEPIGVIVPLKTVKEVSRIFGHSDDEVRISVLEGQIIFADEDVILASRLVEGDFPKYDMIIPKDHQTTITLNKDALLGALRRVAVLANPRTFSLRLDVSGSIARVSTQTPELGEAYETVEIIEGEGDLAIAFDSRFIVEAVSNINSTDIDILLKDPLSSALLKPAGNDREHICLIMPMRLEDKEVKTSDETQEPEVQED